MLKRHIGLIVGVLITPPLAFFVFNPEPTGRSLVFFYSLVALFPYSAILMQAPGWGALGLLLQAIQFPVYGLYCDRSRQLGSRRGLVWMGTAHILALAAASIIAVWS